MKQAVMMSPGVIEFRDVPVPECGPEHVFIRVKRIGVCGSDIHVWHGNHINTPYPVVQGHEVSGVIEKVGGSVRGLAAGDLVTFQPQVTCGTCYSCWDEAYHICDNLKVMGFQTPGAASEFFTVEASKVLKLPRNMDPEHGAMVEPAAVAVHALAKVADVTGRNVLVLGAGPIGNLVAQVTLGLGAAKVMITDVSDFRLGKAKECGINLCVNVATADLAVALKSHYGDDKADLILECVGSPDTITQAVKLARKGTDIVLVGVFGQNPVVDLGIVQDRELRLIGTLMYREPDWKKAIEMVQSGRIRLGPLVTDRFAFGDYRQAYEYIERNRERTMKVMIRVDA